MAIDALDFRPTILGVFGINVEKGVGIRLLVRSSGIIIKENIPFPIFGVCGISFGVEKGVKFSLFPKGFILP